MFLKGCNFVIIWYNKTIIFVTKLLQTVRGFKFAEHNYRINYKSNCKHQAKTQFNNFKNQVGRFKKGFQKEACI